MKRREKIPSIGWIRFSGTPSNWLWLLGWWVVAAICVSPIGRSLIGDIAAIVFALLSFVIGVAGAFTYGSVSGWLRIIRFVTSFRNRHTPTVFIDQKLSITPIVLKTGETVYESTSGLNLTLSVVHLGVEGLPTYLGVVHGEELSTIYLKTSGNSRINMADDEERERLDKLYSRALKEAGFDASDNKLRIDEVTARRPSNSEGLLVDWFRVVHEDVIRALLYICNLLKIEVDEDVPSPGSVNRATNIIDRAEDDVVDGVEYVHTFAVSMKTPKSWKPNVNSQNPHETSQAKLISVAQTLQLWLGKAGYENVEFQDYLQTHRLVKQLMDIFRLPYYISRLQQDVREDRPLKDSEALQEGPWPPLVTDDGRVVVFDQDSFFRPMRRSSGKGKYIPPGGLDRLMTSLPGWYTACQSHTLVPLSTRGLRDRFVTPVKSAVTTDLQARQLGEDDPAVRDARAAETQQREDEYESGGNTFQQTSIVVAGATEYKECLYFGEEIERLYKRYKLNMGRLALPEDRVATVVRAAGLPL